MESASAAAIKAVISLQVNKKIDSNKAQALKEAITLKKVDPEAFNALDEQSQIDFKLDASPGVLLF